MSQRQAKAQCGSHSLASVDGATKLATCLRGCRNPSHRLLVDQSEASPRNSPCHAQYGWNMSCLTFFSTRRVENAALYLGLSLPLAYYRLNAMHFLSVLAVHIHLWSKRRPIVIPTQHLMADFVISLCLPCHKQPSSGRKRSRLVNVNIWQPITPQL